MATWRRKALELFPDLRGEIQERGSTIYTVFFALLPRLREAHRAGDAAELDAIYGYAAWCAGQNTTDLWNAAGVCFYEHLPDARQTKAAMADRIPPDVFPRVAGLLEARMEADEFAALKKQFDRAV